MLCRKVSAFVVAVLLSSAVLAQSSEQGDYEKKLDALQQQINTLQLQLQALRMKGAPADSSAALAAAEPPAASAATVAAATPSQPEAATPEEDPRHSAPFAFADFTWLNGNSRTKNTPYATK